MKFFKQFAVLCLVVVAFFLTSPPTEAGTISTNISAGFHLLTTNQYTINSISVANAGASVATVTLYNSSTATNTYAIGAYSNYVTTVGTTTNIYTNAFGSITTNTYQTVTKTLQSNAASVGNRSAITTIVAPTNATTVFTSSSGTVAGLGISVTNNATVTVTIDYR